MSTEKIPGTGKCGYVVFFEGRRAEVWADTIVQAVDRARAHWKPAKSRRHLVHAVLAVRDGEQVTHKPQDVTP